LPHWVAAGWVLFCCVLAPPAGRCFSAPRSGYPGLFWFCFPFGARPCFLLCWPVCRVSLAAYSAPPVLPPSAGPPTRGRLPLQTRHALPGSHFSFRAASRVRLVDKRGGRGVQLGPPCMRVRRGRTAAAWGSWAPGGLLGLCTVAGGRVLHAVLSWLLLNPNFLGDSAAPHLFCDLLRVVMHAVCGPLLYLCRCRYHGLV
jgi:hypothetical protein